MTRDLRGGPPGRVAGQPPLHETQPANAPTTDPGQPTGAREFERTGDGPGDPTVADTGTTVVALAAADAVVLAADRRASVGGGRFVSSKDVPKIDAVHPTAATAGSGTVGHIQQFTDRLAAESSLYRARRGERLDLDALATVAGTLLRSAPLRVSPVLGGVDESGPAVYDLDGGGGVLSETHAAGGSGMQLAYGVLEREFEPGMTVADARGVAARAIESASERDTASGNGLSVAVVDREGVDVEVHDTPAEVGA